jgi:hypothetical protein
VISPSTVTKSRSPPSCSSGADLDIPINNAGEIPNRWIAEAVAADLGCATRSITMDEAAEVWGGFDALIMGACNRSRSPRTRRELDWASTHNDLLTMVGAPHLRLITARQRHKHA